MTRSYDQQDQQYGQQTSSDGAWQPNDTAHNGEAYGEQGWHQAQEPGTGEGWGHDAGKPVFAFGQEGMTFSVNPDDNPDGHDRPHHDTGVYVQFSIWNTGGAAGPCKITIYVDGQVAGQIEYPEIDPQQSFDFPNGLMHRIEAGNHTVAAVIDNDGMQGYDMLEAQLDVE